MSLAVDDPKYGLDTDLKDLDIILVHDPIRTKNGGIDVIANIARFLDAPVYTLRQTKHPDPLSGIDVHQFGGQETKTSRIFHRFGLGRLLDIAKIHEYQNWSPPRSADVVVTTGPRSQHVIHHADQHRIHFFNTPARWLWDLSHEQWDDRNRFVRRLMLAYATHIRNIDVTSTHRFDQIVANSDLVAKRINAYYNRDATVAYCPVDTFDFDGGEDNGYYVMVNRLVPEKRVKLVVEAFNELGLPLKIAGTAGEATEEYADECRRLAEENIEFLGWVEGDDKVELLEQARALVFAGEHEDFGMPPVEAMAAGKPVVGVNEGFTKYQIHENENGVLFEPTNKGVISAVKRIESVSWDSKTIQEQSRRFDIREMRRVWQDVIRKVTG